METIDLSRYEGIFRDLAIPPRPLAVTVLFEEMSRDEPDLTRVSKCIAADVGLSAAMLRAINSPVFGLGRKVSSVAQAVALLGLRNVGNVATGIAIRHSLKGNGSGPSMERFWDTAEKTALLCGHLARSLRGIPADEAYTFGLFHDCGIPLLIQKFPRYKSTLVRANEAIGVAFTKVEDVEVGTNHAAVGYFLARSWQLPGDLCQAILMHHDTGVFDAHEVPGTVRNLVGLVQLAEHIQHLSMRSSEDAEWIKFEAAVTRHFALDGEDVINLIDETEAILLAESAGSLSAE